MMNRHTFEAADRTLRDILHPVRSYAKDHVFGGFTMALSGDFRQILPVVDKGG